MGFWFKWEQENLLSKLTDLYNHHFLDKLLQKWKYLYFKKVGSDHIVQSGIGKCNLSSCTHKKIPSLKVMLPRFETIGPLGPLRFLLHSKKKEKKEKRLSTRKSNSWWKKFDPKTNTTSKNQVNKFPDHEKISRSNWTKRKIVKSIIF